MQYKQVTIYAIHTPPESWCFRQGWVNKRSLYIFIWGMQFINTSSFDYLSSRNQIINNKRIKESKKRRLYANKCESQVAHVAQANGCQLTYNWQIGVCALYTACTKACTNHSGGEGGIRRKAGSLQAPLVDANVSIALPNIFLLTFYTPHILSSILQSSQFDPFFLYFFTHHYFAATMYKEDFETVKYSQTRKRTYH